MKIWHLIRNHHVTSRNETVNVRGRCGVHSRITITSSVCSCGKTWFSR